jgi:hypothetical protein
MKTEEEIKKILKIKEQIKQNATVLNKKKKELRKAHRESKPGGVISALHKSISMLRGETRYLHIIYEEVRSIPISKIKRINNWCPNEFFLLGIREKYLR